MRTRSRLPFLTAVIGLLTSVVTVRTALAQTVAPVTLTASFWLTTALHSPMRARIGARRPNSLQSAFRYPMAISALLTSRVEWRDHDTQARLLAAKTRVRSQRGYDQRALRDSADTGRHRCRGGDNRRRGGRLQGFNDRRVRNNFGYFFDQNDIRKRGRVTSVSYFVHSGGEASGITSSRERTRAAHCTPESGSTECARMR